MREIAPAALRYQFLRPGPGKEPWMTGGITGGLAAGATIAGAVWTGAPHLVVLAPIVGLVLGGAAALMSGPLTSMKNLRAVAVSIVPWGIVIDPDKRPEPVRWSRVRSVQYTLVARDRRDDDLAPKMAIMTFQVGEQRIQAQAEQGEWVVSVTALHETLAHAADTPPAGDLDGTAPLDTVGLPVPLALVHRAAAILDSADGRAQLGLQAGSYRTTAARIPGLETRTALRTALFNGAAPFDPGPLACLLAAQLGVGTLLQDILQLILSPSPLLALTARAAAVRLGASLMTAGSLDEVRHFASPADILELREWMRRPG